MPPPGPRWVIWGQLRPYSETEGASSTPRSRYYPTPSPPNIRSDPERSECIPHSERTPSPQRCPFWQRGSTGSARQRIGVREARTRLASSPPSAAAGSAARNGCRAHSTAVAPAGRFERPSGIPQLLLSGACGDFSDVVCFALPAVFLTRKIVPIACTQGPRQGQFETCLCRVLHPHGEPLATRSMHRQSANESEMLPLSLVCSPQPFYR